MAVRSTLSIDCGKLPSSSTKLRSRSAVMAWDRNNVGSSQGDLMSSERQRVAHATNFIEDGQDLKPARATVFSMQADVASM